MSDVLIGIDLGGTKIEVAALARGDGRVLLRERVATPVGDYDGTVAAISALVQRATAALGTGPLPVGVGIPGCASPATGLVKGANSTVLIGRPLRDDLERAVGAPVRLANDANCLALSEATDGAGAGAEVVFAVILGTGSGAGIAVNGRVLTGPNGLAGEWGHNELPWAGPADPHWACYCGQVGCIETLVAGPGLARDHGGPGQPSAVQIAAAAAAGDPRAQATLARHAERLARALSQVINLLDPDVIVFGGGLSRMEHLYTEVPRLWSRHVFAAGAEGQPLRTRLRPAQHGDSSGVRGAAWLGQADESRR